MSTAPAVTICMPAYNCEHTIEVSIASALEQSFGDFECLVVDNASTDATVDRVMAIKDPRIRVLRNTSNIGPIANHNRCIEQARGQLIQFLHSDDRLLPECLDRLVPTFADVRVGMAFARRRIESSDPKWENMIGTLHTHLEPLGGTNDGKTIVRKYVDRGSRGNWIGEPTSVMIRRSALLAVGGFDSRQRSYSDMDLWLRILAQFDAAWVDAELSVRVQHEDTLTARYEDTDEAWLDRLWILAGLAHDRNLDRRIRSKAWRQWVVAAMKKVVRSQQAARGVRRAKYEQLGRHVRESLIWDASCPTTRLSA